MLVGVFRTDYLKELREGLARVIILDASVLIGHFESADAHHTDATALLRAHALESFAASVIILAEVYVDAVRYGQADQLRRRVAQLQIACIFRLAPPVASVSCVLYSAEQHNITIATVDDKARRSGSRPGISRSIDHGTRCWHRMYSVHTQGLTSNQLVCTVYVRTSEATMSNPNAPTKTARDQRLNFRASAQQQQLIRQAAEATDRTVTDFILGSVLETAERVLADRKWFVASEEQWVQFQALLDAPLEPTPKLRRLLRRESPFAETD